MTHEKVLTMINYEIGLGETGVASGDLSFLYALRAVVELHKPFISEGKETNLCDGCTQCWGCGEWGASADCPCDKYPCPIIQAIEKELK